MEIVALILLILMAIGGAIAWFDDVMNGRNQGGNNNWRNWR